MPHTLQSCIVLSLVDSKFHDLHRWFADTYDRFFIFGITVLLIIPLLVSI